MTTLLDGCVRASVEDERIRSSQLDLELRKDMDLIPSQRADATCLSVVFKFRVHHFLAGASTHLGWSLNLKLRVNKLLVPFPIRGCYRA